LISAAPYRDRVVHHALMNVLEPILDRRFHPHSYACRKGKGTHAAADRLQNLMRRRRYALQCDIRKFFPSIDHLLLKATCRRFVKDGRVLGLLDLIIDHSNEQEADRQGGCSAAAGRVDRPRLAGQQRPAACPAEWGMGVRRTMTTRAMYVRAAGTSGFG